ncbi:MAG: hypothetical protein EXR75_01875 [Myxococcales bacterium]|nr:hypothetical protein [Myxococcales bacterium]
MWVRSAAIRPVPSHAQLTREALERTEGRLGDDDAIAEAQLDALFSELEDKQPVLAARLGHAFSRDRDELATALGYFLSLVIFKAFDDAFGSLLEPVDELSLRSVEEALALDEELRGADPSEVVDSDDVVAMEQPHLLSFIQEHIDNALEVHAASANVDAIHAVYRVLIVEVLALSYAVAIPTDLTANSQELQA